MTVLDAVLLLHSTPTPSASALGYVCWKMMPLQLKCRNKQISQKRANKTPLHAVGNTGWEIPLVRYVCAQVSHSDTQPGQAKSFHQPVHKPAKESTKLSRHLNYESRAKFYNSMWNTKNMHEKQKRERGKEGKKLSNFLQLQILIRRL